MQPASVFVVSEDFNFFKAADVVKQLNTMGYVGFTASAVGPLEPVNPGDFAMCTSADIFLMLDRNESQEDNPRAAILLGAAVTSGARIVFAGDVSTTKNFPHVKRFSSWQDVKENYFEKISTLLHTAKRS